MVAEIYSRSRPNRYIEKIEPVTPEELEVLRDAIGREREKITNLTRSITELKKTIFNLTEKHSIIIREIHNISHTNQSQIRHPNTTIKYLERLVYKKIKIEHKIEKKTKWLSKKETKLVISKDNEIKLIKAEHDLK